MTKFSRSSKYLLLLALTLAGCALVQTAPTGVLPDKVQVYAACTAEEATGKSSAQSPDCIAYFLLNNGCAVASLGQILNLLPVDGSMFAEAGAISVAACTQYGWYTPISVASPIVK
jgi:hypothetical protein